jgi:transglutaminase-like putative cysteine protease
MTGKARSVELLVLTMFAALPLYFTYTIGALPLLAFHAAMFGIVVRVISGRSPELLPAPVMRALAVAYVPFYFVDWRFISGSALAASVHLLLFVCVYQPMEPQHRERRGQRLLTTSLIFTASLATSTHVTVLPFVLAFAYLMFRQLMEMSHEETAVSVDGTFAPLPVRRAAGFYLLGSIAIGAAIFPFLPRVRSPFLQGYAGPLEGSSTAISETIDFTRPRLTSTDPTVVARVWVPPDARPYFTPVRLRGRIYDRFARGEWIQTYRGMRDVPSVAGTFELNRPRNVMRTITIQHHPQRGRLFLPVGTYALSGLSARLYEGAAPETYFTYQDGVLNLTAQVSTEAEPLSLTRVTPLEYPVSPEIAALARRIVGGETRPERQAALIENYLSKNFEYLPNPSVLGKTMSVDDFLLRDRRGHCEYFAAGMVVLLRALDVPARIAGGYYGGRYNPLGGYYSIRREDAHAWTEVWNGTRWVTYDSTPEPLRPGQSGGSVVREYLAGVGDSLTFMWDRYVLTFSLADQVSLAEDAIAAAREWAAGVHAPRIGTPAVSTIAILLACILVAFIALTLRRRTLFDALASHLADRGVEVGPSTTMEDALRVLRVQQPEAAQELEPLIRLYEEERFSKTRQRGRARAIRKRLAAM